MPVASSGLELLVLSLWVVPGSVYLCLVIAGLLVGSAAICPPQLRATGIVPCWWWSCFCWDQLWLSLCLCLWADLLMYLCDRLLANIPNVSKLLCFLSKYAAYILVLMQFGMCVVNIPA